MPNLGMRLHAVPRLFPPRRCCIWRATRLRSHAKVRQGGLLLFFTLNREDFSFVIHLDRQPRTSRRREAQTGSRARSGSRSERTLDAVEHSHTLMEWWPFLIFHRGGLRIKVINDNCMAGWLASQAFGACAVCCWQCVRIPLQKKKRLRSIYRAAKVVSAILAVI